MSRLELIERSVEVRGKRHFDKYQCVCGKIIVAARCDVKGGHTKSCGCLRKEMTSQRTFKHGLIKHPLFGVWHNIIRRCEKSNDPHFKDYGARGVRICDEWRNDFKAFYDWCMANGWRRGLEVDKDIKADGLLYSPNTCIIVTHKTNSNKRRNNVYYEYNSALKTLSEWAELYKIGRTTLRGRLQNGWDMKMALLTPINATKINSFVGRHNKIQHSFGYIN